MRGRRRKKIVLWFPLPSRWKMAATAFLLAVMMLAYYVRLPDSQTWSAWSMPLSGMVIALDPGHGGYDGGAVSKDGLMEKEVTLQIALYLRDYLQEAGASVVMTRETDRHWTDEEAGGTRKYQDLKKRLEIVEASDPDLFVSIHINSMGSARWRGAQTFYARDEEKSKALAALIQYELIRNLENTDRVAKKLDRDIWLMNRVQVPAALVEAGFLSNPEEAALLGDPMYQKKVAASIYQGILRYTSGEPFG